MGIGGLLLDSYACMREFNQDVKQTKQKNQPTLQVSKYHMKVILWLGEVEWVSQLNVFHI